MNRRRSERRATRLLFDIYDQTRYLGRYWSGNVSQEGLFVKTATTKHLPDGILTLSFRYRGQDYRLRGIVVHRTRDKGVGIQLAYWRQADRPAHVAYLELTSPHDRSEAA